MASTSSDLRLFVASDGVSLAYGGERADVLVNRIRNEAGPADLPLQRPENFQRPAQPFDEARSRSGARQAPAPSAAGRSTVPSPIARRRPSRRYERRQSSPKARRRQP